MQDVGPHIRQFAQLLVRYLIYDTGIVHYPRIGGHKAVHVGPVLVHFRAHRSRDDRARNIRTASAERMDTSVGIGAVESGNDRLTDLGKLLGGFFVGFFGSEHAVVVKDYEFRRVHEFVAEFLCENDRAEIFASAGAVIDRIRRGHLFLDFVQYGFDIEVQPQLLHYLYEARSYLGKSRAALAVYLQIVIAGVEHIGDLGVVGKSLARCRHHYVVALGIGSHDLRRSLHRRRVRHRRSAELDCFLCHFLSPLFVLRKVYLIFLASQ